MKKAVFRVAIVTLIFAMCGGTAGALSAEEAAEVAAERANFGYLMTEITPSKTKKGKMKLYSSNGRFLSTNITLYGYRLSTAINPASILSPVSLSGKTDFYAVANIPFYGAYSVAMATSGGLPLGPGENMRFYYSLSVVTNGGGSSVWLGTKIADYTGCAEDADYQEGVVCKLREEVAGVLYYDAYIGGKLMNGSTGGGENDNNDNTNGDGSSETDEGGGENGSVDGGGDENAGNDGGVEGGSDDSGRGGEEKENVGTTEASVPSNDTSNGEKTILGNSVVKNTKTDTSGQSGLSDSFIAMADNNGNKKDLAASGGRADEPEVSTRRIVRFEWIWLWWILLIVLTIGLILIIWKKKRERDARTAGRKVVSA